LLLVVGRVIGDDDQVPLAHLARGGAVQADHPGIALPPDDVRGEPDAVVDVVDVALLVLDQPRSLHERLVDRDAPLVVEHRLRHRRPVNLALEHGAHHDASPPSRVMLSISLAGPTRAAKRTVIRSAGPESGGSVSGSRASAYSSAARGSARTSFAAAAVIFPGSLSPRRKTSLR